MLGLLGILLALGTLILLAYRGYSVLIVAPLAALISVVFAGMPIVASYTQIFMPALAGFISSYFPLFLSGAVFGNLMAVTGYAQAVANAIAALIGRERAIFATVLAGIVLTYGGVSVFVVAFALFPIARETFKAADIPKRLIPATIGLGGFTFAMSALPGNPQIQNVIPTTYFDTTTYAAPWLGVIASIIILGLGMVWLEYRSRTLRSRGEGYSDSDASGLGSTSGGMTGTSGITQVREGRVGYVLAVIPILIVVVVNFIATSIILPRMDTSYLEEELYGGVTLSAVAGVWSVLIALVLAILYMVLVSLPSARGMIREIGEGAKTAVLPIFSTGSEVGFGAVIAAVPAFLLIRDAMSGVGDNPVITTAIATTVLAGITASASGGMSIALGAMGEDLKAAALEQGVSLELMHRVTSVASGGLDTLPHSGAVITLLLICGLTHRQSYKDMAMITVVFPLVSVVAVIALGLQFGAF